MLQTLDGIATGTFVLQILALALLAPWCSLKIWHDTRGARLEFGAAVVFVAVAFLLRWFLPEHAFVHENHHSFGYAPSAALGRTSPHGVPSSTQILAWLLYQFTRHPDVDLTMNAVLSALAVGGAYASVRIVTGSSVGATTAAILLAFQPLAIFLAPTEEYMVSATGFVLVGLPAILYGVRRRLPEMTLAGVLLICLAASTRDIALPISSIMVLAWMAMRDAGRVQRNECLLVLGLPLAMLLPRTILLLVASLDHETGFFGVPHLIVMRGGGTSQWAGWTPPWIAPWFAFGALASVVFLVARSFTREWTLCLAFVAPWVVAFLVGGLPVSGSFPFFLRHQALAMALLILPVGAAAAILASSIEPSVRYYGWSLPAAVGVAAVAWLAAHPESVRPHLPSAQEYLFLRKVLPTLPEEATGVDLAETDGILHVGGAFLQHWRPHWLIEPASQILSQKQTVAKPPIYFVLDRRCFQYAPCKMTQRPCPELLPEARVTLSQTQWGWVIPECKRVLDAAPWREVASARIETPPELARLVTKLAPWSLNGIQIDLPAVTPSVKVAVLVSDDSPPADHGG